MGLFDFVKDAGEALFGGKDDDKNEAPVRTMEDALADKAKGESLTKVVSGMELGIDGLDIDFREGKATIKGTADSQSDLEKVALIVGNTQGVAQVDMQMKVEKPEPEATLYTVVSGDTLGKIAKAHYGDAMKYPMIFEANKPMLKDPDKIYPGQVLRIPPLES